MKTSSQAFQEQMLPFDAFLAPGASPAAISRDLESATDTELLGRLFNDQMAPALIIHEFGSISEAAASNVEEFTYRTGLKPADHALLQVCRELAARLARQPLEKRVLLTSWSALTAYLRIRMAHETREQVRVLYLDKRHQLIRDELAGIGSIDHAPVYVRELMHRAMNLGAAALIISHNHPGGDPTPSRGDIDMTKLLTDAGKALNINVIDHVVVGRDGIYSFRSKGLL